MLAGLTPEKLLETREHDGHTVTVLDAVYHAVEHFSTHTGQVLQLVKLRFGSGLNLTEWLAATG